MLHSIEMEDQISKGFVANADNNSLPISIYNPNLESLLFPHLFPDGKGRKKQINIYFWSK